MTLPWISSRGGGGHPNTRQERCWRPHRGDATRAESAQGCQCRPSHAPPRRSSQMTFEAVVLDRTAWCPHIQRACRVCDLRVRLPYVAPVPVRAFGQCLRITPFVSVRFWTPPRSQFTFSEIVNGIRAVVLAHWCPCPVPRLSSRGRASLGVQSGTSTSRHTP
jgi:hypothetical protein